MGESLQKPLEAVPKLVDTDAALDPASGIDVSGLEPLTRLRVRTLNTLYHLIVLSPEESKVLIQGGRFAEPVEASLGYGGGMLKTHIGLGMPMAIYRENGPVMTSPVRSVQAEGRLQLPGPF